ncbi:MAG: chemotaxis protein CheW [FCB group bacterium]|nr:chemotaxis protein CheW [FCB group bacterium]
MARLTGMSMAVAQAGKYLTFQLGMEFYGIEILKVQEIIGLMPVTRVPRAPEFVRGVINLRGRIIPVMDLRRKFSLEEHEDTERTCIVVARVMLRDRPMTMGLLVDEVSEVLSVKEEQIEAAPSFGANVDTQFLLGMAKVGQKVVMLLDVDRVLTSEEVETLEAVPMAAENGSAQAEE